MTADGDVEVHRTPESMVDTMLLAGGVWWGHNAGKYDTLQVLEILRRGGLGQSISMAQSRVTRTMGNGLTIRDSYALVPMGLEALASIGKKLCPKMWLDCRCGWDCGGYCALRPGMPWYQLKRLEEYCIQDCEAAYYGLVGLQEFADENDLDLTGTIGGSSWNTARRVLELPDAEFEGAEWRLIRSAFYGGRCNVFRPVVKQSGTHWDISSAYPSSLANAELPTGRMTQHGAKSAITALAKESPGIYSCTISIRDNEPFPCLPWGWGTGISFPVGVVSGTYTTSDIRYAIENGATLESVHWGIVWKSRLQVFRDWVPNIYEKRIAAGKSTAIGQWLRLFPNSLVGKMAERPEKQFLRMNPPISDIVCCPAEKPCTLTSCSGACGAWEQIDQNGHMWGIPFYRMSESAHIHWAAYVTAGTRAQLHTELVRHGEDSVYCDTDSLWTTSKELPEPEGDALGHWSRQCDFLDFESPAPKHYAYTDEKTGEWVVRSAGAALHPREWTRGHSVQDRGVLSLKEAARRGRGLFVRAHRKWTLPSHGEWYGDRVMSGDGMTRPVTCDRLRIRLDERNRQRAERRKEAE